MLFAEIKMCACSACINLRAKLIKHIYMHLYSVILQSLYQPLEVQVVYQVINNISRGLEWSMV